MTITFKRSARRTTLACYRPDGSSTHADLGPDFPYHDLAHYVVESHFRLQEGFFGKIRDGMSIAELSDGAVIRTLGPEAWLAEVLTRNLQSLGGGGIGPEEFVGLVKWEADSMPGLSLPEFGEEEVNAMATRYRELCEHWRGLGEGESLSLEFD